MEYVSIKNCFIHIFSFLININILLNNTFTFYPAYKALLTAAGLILSGMYPASASPYSHFCNGGKNLPVSASVRAPAEMPLSANEVMSK